jgi:hypothetical protein
MIQGRVDEIVTTQEDEPTNWETRVRAAHQGLTPTAWPVPTDLSNSATAYDSCLKNEVALQNLRAGMTFKLDDELLAVTDVAGGTNGQGLQLLRGVLATAPAQHGAEATFWWNFPFPRAAISQFGFNKPKDADFSVRPGAAPYLHDRDFVVAIDRGGGNGVLELLPIRSRVKDTLYRPRDALDRGAFRGAFGSGVVNPEPMPGELLFDFPFRYQDRYQPRVRSIEGVFFEATKELPGAFFESITWEADLPNPYTKVILAVRVDGAPDWDAEPAKREEPGQKGKLYLFDSPQEANQLLLRGDKVEIRAYLTYKPQAFLPGVAQPGGQGDGWKQTPILRAIRLTYRQPTRVRRHEELMD